MDFETRAIHEGQQPDPATGAITTPIYQTSTYVQEEVGKHKGYDYSRAGNPTRDRARDVPCLARERDHGFAFSSGLGGVTTLMHLVSPGETSSRSTTSTAAPTGCSRRSTSRRDTASRSSRPATSTGLADHLDDDTRLVWLESPTNPLLNVIDIQAAAEAAHAKGAIVVVDNTFATPYLQRPLELGADVVLHSTTKYLGGHSDVIGGFVATNDPTIAERLRFLQKSLGAIPGPFDSWLVLRGLKTLAVRMDRHCENARRIAAWLDEHEAVERVLYPGLPDHPGHDIAARQMSDFGGMISFLAASEEDAIRLVAETKVWKLAESLGGVESLIEQAAQMTHASTADAPFAVPGNLVRLSVGIESVDDLLADLEQALSAVTAKTS